MNPFKLVVACLLTMPGFGLHAQSGELTNFASRSYQQLATQAETAILAGNFARADSLYDRSFTHCGGFASDMHNAAVTALLVGKREKAKRYLVQLVDRGVDADVLSSYREEYYPELLDEWEELYPMLREHEQRYASTVNSAYIAALDSINAEDQAVRRGNFAEEGRAVDSTNILALLALFEKNGFPSEAELDLESPFTQRLPYYLPLLHEAKKVNLIGDRFGVLPILRQALADCKISPHMFSSLMVHFDAAMGGMGKYGETVVVSLQEEANDTLYRLVKSPEEIALINRNRASLGLSSYDERVARLVAYLEGSLDRKRFSLPRNRVRISYPAFLRQQVELRPVGYFAPFGEIRY
jgi:hypothetical protein